MVSYTCDVRPSVGAQQRIRSWVEAGGRWVALHGTNSALGDASVRPIATPRAFPLWADTLGSQFIAHPPIEPYRVDITMPEHWSKMKKAFRQGRESTSFHHWKWNELMLEPTMNLRDKIFNHR